MGIENCCRPAAARRWSPATHYPSWGSKTTGGAASGESAQPSHYPSWGSKTWSRATGNADDFRNSLPLMGIENAKEEVEPGADPLHLITPHGDRKLDPNIGRSMPNATDSLPLMGIENKSVKMGVRVTKTFSLPLMGIENSVPTGLVRREARFSLPLMGIENVTSTAGASSGGLSLHYPSWGSKT